ncbi:hypothetical protein [Bauldia litoralis]|uniref:hypothetical protein n=1 Tax=Bauldia litoralis TaxID=665467 RepID=UPI003264A2CE
MKPTVNLTQLENQFRGRRLAELVLTHVKAGSQKSMSAMLEEMDKLPEELNEGIADFLDTINDIVTKNSSAFFGDDLGNKLREIVDLARNYFLARDGVKLTDDQSFTCFQIVVLNFAYACFKNPSSKAAMQKAAGKGFLRRLFS